MTLIINVSIKLKLSAIQVASIVEMIATLNRACAWIASRAVQTNTFSRFALHRVTYSEARKLFGLKSQQCIQAVAKVAHAMAKVKKAGGDVSAIRFRRNGAFPYDDRMFSIEPDGTISILTLTDRIRVPFSVAPHEARLIGDPAKVGASNLQVRRGKVYLHLHVEEDPPKPAAPIGHLGVDLGIINIAADSDGCTYSGDLVEAVRQRYALRQQRLQKVGTRSSRKRVKKISGKEARFRQIQNHRISKALVAKAQGTGRGIALENLRGIHERKTVRRSQRSRHKGWAFAQLRTFIAYKARRAGVEVKILDPAYSSQTCPVCAHRDRKNRPTRDRFVCQKCGHAGAADTIAAVNLSHWAEVNRPMASSEGSHGSKSQVQVSGRKIGG